MGKSRVDPVEVFIEQALVPSWDATKAVGFDIDASSGTEAFFPVGEDLSDVGAAYPHLTVQRTNETAPGTTGYNFITSEGPGQDRTGQLLVTARAEESDDGYTGDSSTYTAEDADDIVEIFADMVEETTLENATALDTDFNSLSSFPGADAPNDYESTPTVFIEQVLVTYTYQRYP